MDNCPIAETGPEAEGGTYGQDLVYAVLSQGRTATTRFLLGCTVKLHTMSWGIIAPTHWRQSQHYGCVASERHNA
jgi:hypothetical protein